MKKLGVICCVLVVLASACGKKETGCQPVSVVSEKSQLIAYCNANNITYTEHTSGLLYQIIDPGTGVAPTSSSTVSVVYTGKFLDGTVFTAVANPQDLSLMNVIDAWKIGIPLLKKGGRIKLVIPSALGYSCTGNLPYIQPNTPLYYDVTLSDVK